MLLDSFNDSVGLFRTMSSGLPGLFQDIAKTEFHQGEILAHKSIDIYPHFVRYPL